MATVKPLPTSPSRALSGTRTASKASSAVAWPRRPSLPWISVRVKPGRSVGTRKAVMPRWPGSPVRAKTRATSAQVPLVMKVLVPLSDHWPSLPRTARVVRLAASDPVPGSVRAKQPSASPEVSRGSQCRFCSSVP